MPIALAIVIILSCIVNVIFVILIFRRATRMEDILIDLIVQQQDFVEQQTIFKNCLDGLPQDIINAAFYASETEGHA